MPGVEGGDNLQTRPNLEASITERFDQGIGFHRNGVLGIKPAASFRTIREF
jgi:hypothetical protein